MGSEMCIRDRSVRSSTRDSETTAVSSDLKEEIRQLYLTIVAAAEGQGYSSQVSNAIAKRKVELTYPQFAGSQDATSATAGTQSRSASQPGNAGTAVDASAKIEAAIAALEADGLTREEAVERLRESLLARQDPERNQSTSRAKGKGKGKEKAK